MISRIIKVEASANSRGRMITLAETLTIPEITKTEFNYCFTIQRLMENIKNLLCEMQIQGANAPSGRITPNHSSALFRQSCALRTAQI